MRPNSDSELKQSIPLKFSTGYLGRLFPAEAGCSHMAKLSQEHSLLTNVRAVPCILTTENNSSFSRSLLDALGSIFDAASQKERYREGCCTSNPLPYLANHRRLSCRSPVFDWLTQRREFTSFSPFAASCLVSRIRAATMLGSPHHLCCSEEQELGNAVKMRVKELGD